jgi:hypothetical protein
MHLVLLVSFETWMHGKSCWMGLIPGVSCHLRYRPCLLSGYLELWPEKRFVVVSLYIGNLPTLSCSVKPKMQKRGKRKEAKEQIKDGRMQAPENPFNYPMRAETSSFCAHQKSSTYCDSPAELLPEWRKELSVGD